MRYIKPDYYDKFTCVAGECLDTCCAGWQIMIDDKSLERYGKVQGAFGQRLRNFIDWEEGSFFQCGRRCAFLNGEDLCDIYTELGEDALCDTCTNYPRHVEEYEGLRELSLSLSCPVAAKMILSQEHFPVFCEYEDEAPEALAEEFEDFDTLLFTQLEDARNAVMKHLCEVPGSLGEKMNLYLSFAGRLQGCMDRGEYFEIDTEIRKFEKKGLELSDVEEEKKERFNHRKALYGHILELERLREEWTDVLEFLGEELYGRGEEAYLQCVEEFEAYLRMDGLEGETSRWAQWERIGIQLFVFFLYTYFCGAVYDDWIYSKMALAVESVRFLRELYLHRWLKKGRLEMEDYVELAYRYAREIEHSDQNLNELEEVFGESVE